ncbi:hypothetical protein ACFQZQ_02300 [Lysobacter koreensis]|uniref:Uncharacterized protein n=1 Tax=Lysobacter koreensis TaxID=266122 RepID=A0ABW2YNW0_9GAMM
MTVPGSPIFAAAVFATSVASLLAAPPARAQEWLRWQHPSIPLGVDPAKQVLPAAPPASASSTISRAAPQPALSAAATRQSRVPGQKARAALKTGSTQALLTPVLTNPVGLPEPLPAPVRTAVETTTLSDLHLQPAASGEASETSMHTDPCEEADGCGRLETTRSGVGVSSAPETEDAKRKPETAAKRHVMQAVRSVW